MKVRNNRSFPPASIIDLERKGAGRFLDLAAAVRSGPATLVLGAGASASAGLPDWRRLLIHICQVFYGHWQDEIQRGSAAVARPPKNLSIVFAHAGEWWNDDVLAMGEEFARSDPILVAQQIKNCIRDVDWYYLLRKALYTSPDEEPLDTTQSVLLDRVACLCSRVGNVKAIINYNYDDVFESYLSLHNVRYSVIWDSSRVPKHNSLPVYHTHGYLRRKGGPNTRLILAESEYYEEIAAPYSWGNLIQTAQLTNSTCAFVGTSMTDPNLRRLLRTTSMLRSRPHYVFLPADRSTAVEMRNALFDRDLENLGVAVIRYPVTAVAGHEHRRLPELMDLLAACITDESVLWTRGKGTATEQLKIAD